MREKLQQDLHGGATQPKNNSALTVWLQLYTDERSFNALEYIKAYIVLIPSLDNERRRLRVHKQTFLNSAALSLTHWAGHIGVCRFVCVINLCVCVCTSDVRLCECSYAIAVCYRPLAVVRWIHVRLVSSPFNHYKCWSVIIYKCKHKQHSTIDCIAVVTACRAWNDSATGDLVPGFQLSPMMPGITRTMSNESKSCVTTLRKLFTPMCLWHQAA